MGETRSYKKYPALVAVTRGLRELGRRGVRAIGYVARKRAIRSYLETHQMRKLQLGAGHNPLPGWLNTDIYPSSRRRHVFLDATKPFPLPDAAFEYVFSEHVIEHIPYADGLAMLRECFRVLMPQGRIRVGTPCLETILAVRASETDLQTRYIRFMTDRYIPDVKVYRHCFVINNAFRNWGHQFIYDRETLQGALEEVGFVDVACAAPGESEDPCLRGIECHGEVIGDEEINRFETLVLEARRP